MELRLDEREWTAGSAAAPRRPAARPSPDAVCSSCGDGLGSSLPAGVPTGVRHYTIHARRAARNVPGSCPRLRSGARGPVTAVIRGVVLLEGDLDVVAGGQGDPRGSRDDARRSHLAGDGDDHGQDILEDDAGPLRGADRDQVRRLRGVQRDERPDPEERLGALVQAMKTRAGRRGPSCAPINLVPDRQPAEGLLGGLHDATPPPWCERPRSASSRRCGGCRRVGALPDLAGEHDEHDGIVSAPTSV